LIALLLHYYGDNNYDWDTLIPLSVLLESSFEKVLLDLIWQTVFAN